MAKYVNDDIRKPPQGISNISEWCKKEDCWERLQAGVGKLKEQIPEDFWNSLVSLKDQQEEVKSASKTQRIDDGINAQKQVFEISAEQWSKLRAAGEQKNIFTTKELGILRVAERIPAKVPSEKQCAVLMDVLRKAESEGIHYK